MGGRGGPALEGLPGGEAPSRVLSAEDEQALLRGCGLWIPGRGSGVGTAEVYSGGLDGRVGGRMVRGEAGEGSMGQIACHTVGCGLLLGKAIRAPTES